MMGKKQKKITQENYGSESDMSYALVDGNKHSDSRESHFLLIRNEEDRNKELSGSSFCSTCDAFSG